VKVVWLLFNKRERKGVTDRQTDSLKVVINYADNCRATETTILTDAGVENCHFVVDDVSSHSRSVEAFWRHHVQLDRCRQALDHSHGTRLARHL